MKLFAPNRDPAAAGNPENLRASAQVLPAHPPTGINEPNGNDNQSGIDQADGQNHHRRR